MLERDVVTLYFPTIDGMMEARELFAGEETVMNQDYVEQFWRKKFINNEDNKYYETLKQSLELNGFDKDILGTPDFFRKIVKENKNSITTTLKALKLDGAEANSIWATNASILAVECIEQNPQITKIILSPKVAENETASREILDLFLNNNKNVELKILETNRTPEMVAERARRANNTNFINLNQEEAEERVKEQINTVNINLSILRNYISELKIASLNEVFQETSENIKNYKKIASLNEVFQETSKNIKNYQKI